MRSPVYPGVLEVGTTHTAKHIAKHIFSQSGSLVGLSSSCYMPFVVLEVSGAAQVGDQRTISMEELAKHSTEDDTWIAVDGKVTCIYSTVVTCRVKSPVVTTMKSPCILVYSINTEVVIVITSRDSNDNSNSRIDGKARAAFDMPGFSSFWRITGYTTSHERGYFWRIAGLHHGLILMRQVFSHSVLRFTSVGTVPYHPVALLYM